MIEKIKREINTEGKNMVHLHCHNTYSELDGYGLPEQHTSRCKEIGMSHIAITNHNHLAGVLDFKKACLKDEIKPIFGCELYYTEDTDILNAPKAKRDEMAREKLRKKLGIKEDKKSKEDKPDFAKNFMNIIAEKEVQDIENYEYDTRQYHILFLAKNQNGWRNLVRLQSEAAIKCTFNGRFLVDNEMMKKHSEDLICTTACIGSKPSRLIQEGKIDEAEKLIDEWHEIFKDDFYLEIQPLNIDKQIITNLTYIKWAKEKGIKLVATNDVHYPRKEDYKNHDVLLCIGLKTTIESNARMRYSHDYWIRSYDEMLEAFYTQTERMIEKSYLKNEDEVRDYINTVIKALDETNNIAKQIDDVTLGSDIPLFPNVDLMEGFNADEELEYKSFKRLYQHISKNPDFFDTQEKIDLYEQRLRTELDVIRKKNYSPYFLAVEDYIKEAQKLGCSVGPSRGSAAGSLVSFLNGIVQVTDPVEHNLLFSRFLTEDRVSPPDIDTDFCFRNRSMLIQYLEDKYGADHVCHIGTVTKLGVKNGIKDVGRVMDYPYNITNRITKELDNILDTPGLTFKKLDALKDGNLEEKNAYKKFVAMEKEHEELFTYARELEGNIRNMGVHAAGVLVTPFPVTDLFPVKLDKEGKRVALYNGDELEELNAIKFDILGLKTITVIEDTLKMIDEDLTIRDLYDKPEILSDEKTFENIRNLNVEGIFQIESDTFKNVIEPMQPREFNDIVALTALCRPGPLSAGMHNMYCDRKNGKAEVREPLPNTMDIVSDSYGTLIYQEHLMLIAKRVAGFDDNQSDTYLRKATARQNADLMNLCRQWFIWGKINEEAPEGYDPNNTEQVMYDPKGKYGNPILGGVNNEYAPGKFYDEKQLKDFWHTIEGFCSYLFNKSHSVAYSVLTMITAWLKTHYPAKFMAASLSMLGSDKVNAEKVKRYTEVTEQMGIKILKPNINISKRDFVEKDGNIIYGFSSVKDVGDKSIDPIIEGQPYESLEDIMERIPKKFFNKRVGRALIKSGAFEDFEENRLKLLNEFYDIRKDKDDRLDIEDWDEETCIKFEEELLGTSITYKTWFNKIEEGKTTEGFGKIKSVREIIDRNGRLMAFLNADIDTSQNVNCVVFAHVYAKNLDKLKKGSEVILRGKKDNGSFLVSSVKDIPKAF